MNSYMYAADLYCEECARKLMSTLAVPVGADLDDETTFDSDEYPKGPFADGGGESDCPQMCAGCHCALGNALTAEGVDYVLTALEREAADLDEANRTMPKPGTGEADPSFARWHDQPHKAIVLEWAHGRGSPYRGVR